jgi:hypothetical protein
MMRRFLLVGLILTSFSARAEHPRLLVRADEREAMKKKVSEHEWAKIAYGVMKARVDEVATEVEKDPKWLVSRLMMNWETHYVLPITRESRWIGGEGRAPVPTPRFGGARDWASTHRLPAELADWKPYNSWADDIWLINREDSEGEWVHPSQTGLTIEVANRHVMKLAAEAAFLYWMTGEERYANVAAPVLWTYMEGFSHVLPPRVEDDERSEGIIGMTSFEVIHEDILVEISQCYDFIHDYLELQGKDPVMVQNGIRRMVDRVIEGGLNEGNWNLFQAKFIAHGGLVLEPDESYADGKGSGYYLDMVLNAELPSQRGLMKVVDEDYDQETALWPEAPGYGFETTQSILEVANLIAADPGGRALLAKPVLERALLAQVELTHPNGLSIGMGDTANERVNALALEKLIAAARVQGKREQEIRLTVLLRREIEEKRYDRRRQDNIYALTNYVGELVEVDTDYGSPLRSYFAKPLNVLMMRLAGGNRQSDLSAAMFGTAGGHAHTNGLAIELFGAGVILAPDPGRGSSYWQRDQRHYYSRLPSHNTVIPNGYADYWLNPPHQLAMKPVELEPAPGSDGVSDRIGFAQAEFQYMKPLVNQRRTLALIRTGENSGFYFDVFRSRATDDKKEGFHDYLYHGMAQAVVMTDMDGGEMQLEECELLGEQHGHLEGYDYFREEKSIESSDAFRARFALELPDGTVPTMDMWMLGGEERRIFSVEAPPNHAIRSGLPAMVSKLAMPTVLVRQQGEAWKRPFVAIYEPYFGKSGPSIRKVRAAKCDGPVEGLVVEGDDLRILLMDSAGGGVKTTVEGLVFDGAIGVVIGKPGKIDEIYLGEGREIGVPGLMIRAKGPGKVSASLKCDAEGVWRCEATGPVEFETEGSLPELFGMGPPAF